LPLLRNVEDSSLGVVFAVFLKRKCDAHASSNQNIFRVQRRLAQEEEKEEKEFYFKATY
jgi:hypothetical protein